MDRSGYLLCANREAQELLGASSLELSKMHASVFFPSAFTGQALITFLEECIESAGKIFTISLPAINRNGRTFLMGIKLRAVMECDSVRLFASLADDSIKRDRKKKLASAEARASEVGQAKNILDTISESFCIVDSSWIIRYWNAAAEMTTGKTREYVLGRHMWEVFPQDNGSMLFEMCNKSMKERISTNFEHFSGKGTYFYNAVHPSEDGGIAIYFKNISIRKNREQEREMLVRELTRNNSDLLQFSFITSHNLRAPLSNILGLVQLLDKDKMDVETARIADMIAHSAEKLSETINDLSEMLLIKNNAGTVRESVSIEEVFLKVRKSFLDAENEIDSHIVLDLKATRVNFNERYLESIFVNLISNAIKYRHPSRKLEINLRSFVIKAEVIIEFIDNGSGIDMDRHGERLFGMYQRFHSSTEGQGLGLFIVKSQVESLGGTIQATSRVGFGTTFKLSFPILE